MGHPTWGLSEMTPYWLSHEVVNFAPKLRLMIMCSRQHCGYCKDGGVWSLLQRGLQRVGHLSYRWLLLCLYCIHKLHKSAGHVQIICEACCITTPFESYACCLMHGSSLVYVLVHTIAWYKKLLPYYCYDKRNTKS